LLLAQVRRSRGCSIKQKHKGRLGNPFVIVDSKRFTFEDRFASLTEKQKAVLLAIAAEYPKELALTRQEFIVRHNLKTASSVQTKGT